MASWVVLICQWDTCMCEINVTPARGLRCLPTNAIPCSSAFCGSCYCTRSKEAAVLMRPVAGPSLGRVMPQLFSVLDLILKWRWRQENDYDCVQLSRRGKTITWMQAAVLAPSPAMVLTNAEHFSYAQTSRVSASSHSFCFPPSSTTTHLSFNCWFHSLLAYHLKL